MSKKPIVSVLMPVYNAERYVAETVESILAQTFTDFEFIIIDDGSRDGSLKILETYAAKDKRIRLTSRDNKGIARTTNEMLGKAEGEFIALMDNDDIALPDRLARQVEFLQANPHVVGVSGTYQFIDEKGRLLLTSPVPENNDQIQRLLLAGYANNMPHPCAMIRRESLIGIGGYSETLKVAADLDMQLRLGEVGELANIKEPILQYRVHMNSACGQKPELYYQEAQAACERAYQRRGIEGRYEPTQEEPMRPGKNRFSQHPFLVKYGWWAFNSGQRQTAIIYGLRAITALPLAVEGWKLLACAVIKPLPTPEYP
jgi:glycosyltransferase involved in cell wall biosynthesis